MFADTFSRFILIVCVFCSIESNTQSIIINYEKTKSIDNCAFKYGSFDFPTPEHPDFQTNYTLIIQNGKSILIRDSLLLKESFENSKLISYFSNTYKDFNQKEVYTSYQDYDCKLILAIDNKSNNNPKIWELIKGKKKEILGLDCQLYKNEDANIPQCIEYAWVAVDLPYPDGCINYISTLPGVILEHYFGEGDTQRIKATNITVEYQKDLHATIPDDAIIVNGIHTKSQDKHKHIELNENTPINKWLKYSD